MVGMARSNVLFCTLLFTLLYTTIALISAEVTLIQSESSISDSSSSPSSSPLLSSSSLTPPTHFNESLLIRPLPSGQLLVHFQFDTRDLDSNGQHFTIFPKSIGQIASASEIHTFSLSLTSGRWRMEDDGYMDKLSQMSDSGVPSSVNHSHVTADGLTPIPTPIESPHGAEMWAVIEPSPSRRSIESRWRQLQSSLAGLFCASLNQMKAPSESKPLEAFAQDTSIPLSTSNFRYGSLPREFVCTENLSPFVKMLPCRSRRGLATLLEPVKLYGSQYHAIQVKLMPVNDLNGKRVGWTFKQTVTVVLDPRSKQYGNFNPAHRQSLTALLENGHQSQISSCPLSSHASVHIHRTAAPFTLEYVGKTSPESKLTPHRTLKFKNGDRIESFDLKRLIQPTSNGPATMDIMFHLQDRASNPLLTSNSASSDLSHLPTLAVIRSLSDPTLYDGTLHTHIRNPSTDVGVELRLYDALPWFCRVEWSSLKLSLNGDIFSSNRLIHRSVSSGAIQSAQSEWYFHLLLPPNSTVSVQVYFSKSLLPTNQYPPDVSRGFDIGSAIIAARTNNSTQANVADDIDHSNSSRWTRFYTPGLVVLLPFPDFSMPFNVIAFTSTVLAFFIGSLFNMTFSKSEEVLKRIPAYQPKTSTSFIKRLFNK